MLKNYFYIIKLNKNKINKTNKIFFNIKFISQNI